jgi:4-amino-4-deoxy-L-arabinose transferase-like glycosyltransferase
MPQILRSKSINNWQVALFVIVMMAAIPRLLTYDFSLPYIDHPDEPYFYNKAQEWRGLFQVPGKNGYPPGIIVVNLVVQIAAEAFGQPGAAPTIRIVRLMAVVANLSTLVLVALTARRIGGNLAGLLAGAAWGIAPVLVQNGVYATADPYVYLLTAAALWTATVALADPHRRHWCVWSVVTGLLAILFKYFAVVAIVPGLLVAAMIFVKDRRRAFRYLAVQALLILVVALWLVLGYQVGRVGSESGPSETQAMAQLRNPAAWLQPGVLFQNIKAGVEPANSTAFLVAGVPGTLAFIVANSRKAKRIRLGMLVPTVLILILVPEVASLLGVVDPGGRLRDVLPATAAACVILGVGFAQVYDLFTRRWRSVGLAALALPLVAFVFIPQIAGCVQLVQDRHREDWRVVMRQWADINLEPGWVIVDPDNHKTFNPYYGGIPGHKTFNWWVTPSITGYPVNTWINDYKMTYAAIPLYDVQVLRSTQAGQNYLAQMLHLRDFVGSQRRGPEVVFYRLWRMENERRDQFGGRISLIGYDGRTEQAVPGETLSLRFYWQASALPQTNYSLYIHLNPMDNRTLLAQVDGSPAAPDRPTLTWDDPNETLISSPFELKLPPDLQAGQYRILVGLYDYGTGQRLTAQTGEDYVELFTLTVSPATEL